MIYYSVDKIAEMLDVHPETVRRWIRSEKLKAFDNGNSYRVSKEELQKFIDNNMTA